MRWKWGGEETVGDISVCCYR
ncbi:unnamed protein product [Ectocarpus sp. CCAP 1310/34]|nr:unnamed protein product [Ectocarpus sp. CCAP 1310/34]